MANPEHPYTGPVLLVGGPHDGQVRQVEDADLLIGIGFHDAPGGLYRPNDETLVIGSDGDEPPTAAEDDRDVQVPVLTFERTDV